ncbi:SPFH domain-containing protein [Kitasatospora sp. NPDC002227]|uniref:SPFH domain-containing protein n=1 Tax=Kitasatospora sp. NPDC002227 TaxID=3154773 RepID=UPI00331F25C9
MDATRDPRPDPPTPLNTANGLTRALAEAVAKPLIRTTPPALAEDELERPTAPTPRVVVPEEPVTGHHPAARRPPRADGTLRERPARALPGWLALLVLLLALAGVAVALARTGVLPHLAALPDLRSAVAKETGGPDVTAPVVAVAAASALVAVLVLAGLLVNGSGETRVLTRWGRYRGTVRRHGLVWVNPALRRLPVDVRLRHWRSEPVTVTDRTGTPIVVQLLIVWRVRDTARAVLGLAEHEDYLREQTHAVLTRTASTLPCDSNSAPGPALRDGNWFADELTRALAAETAPAGLEVYSVQPLALEYAPEVAESMRRRRLADLDAGLRTVLVDDAVEAAALAVRRLERATANELDQAARSALMEQLLVAFVSPAGVPLTAPVPSPGSRAGSHRPAVRTGHQEGRPA